MATFSGRGDGTGVKNPRLKSPFPDIEPRFVGAYFHVDANALYAFESRGFGGEIGVVTVNNFLPTSQDFVETSIHTVLWSERQ